VIVWRGSAIVFDRVVRVARESWVIGT